MISIAKITEIFCLVDDFHQEYEKIIRKHMLAPGQMLRKNEKENFRKVK